MIDTLPPLVAADIAIGDRRYDVHSRLDIVSTMRVLSEGHALISAYGKRATDFIVSAILAVYANNDLLVFDFGAESVTTERVLGAGIVRFVTQLDHIRIQFSAPVAGTMVYEGAPAFLAFIPDVMQRLQRRECYRVRIPLSSPLSMTLMPNPDKPEVAMPLRVLDLSCGGVALADVPLALGLRVGNVYHRCMINLPGLGTITPDFRIARIMRDEMKPGACLLAGPFVDLPAATMMLLQRYINRVERERMARD